MATSAATVEVKMTDVGDAKFVMQITNENVLCDEKSQPTKAQLNEFLKKFRMLRKEELEKAFRISNSEFNDILQHMVPCIGCRRSTEAFYQQLVECGRDKSPFFPICVDKSGTIYLAEGNIKKSFVCSLFYCPSTRMQNTSEMLSKCKPGRRCSLHTIDSQRLRCINSCTEVWDYINGNCRENAVFVEAKTLVATIEQYCHRHQFCTECKSKVMHAYHILVGEVDIRKEMGYVPQLYEGITFNKEDKRLQIACKPDYFDRLLINAATNDLLGGHMERHAKTVEMAQQEVLTCLGICIYERLHRLQSRCKEQQRTCEIVMYIAIQAFRRGFERAVEEKMGVSKLELLCEELSKTDLAGKRSKTLKKKKKKKKKDKNVQVDSKTIDDDEENTSLSDSSSISTPVVVSEKEVKLKPKTAPVLPPIPETQKVPAAKTVKKKCEKCSPQSPSSYQNSKSVSVFGNQNLNAPSTHSNIFLGHTLGHSKSKKTAANKDSERRNGQSSSSSQKFQDSVPDKRQTKCYGAPQTYSSVVKMQNGSGDIEHEKNSREILDPPYKTSDDDADSLSSWTSGESVEDHDFLPDVDKSIIETPIWKEMRRQLREKLIREFNTLVAFSDVGKKCFVCKCDGDTGKKSAPVSKKAESVDKGEGNERRKERIPRPGGLNKSRQSQSTRKYKGKNRQ